MYLSVGDIIQRRSVVHIRGHEQRYCVAVGRMRVSVLRLDRIVLLLKDEDHLVRAVLDLLCEHQSVDVISLGDRPVGINEAFFAAFVVQSQEAVLFERICSPMNFVQPYGFVHQRGASSLIGTFGMP